MKRNTIRLIIFLSVVILVVLVVTQIFWVGKAYEVQEKQFNDEVTRSLRNVALQILQHNNDSTPLIDPVKQLSSGYFTVSINDTLHPFYLESMLKNEFKRQEINTPFQYSIYDCFTDSVVYSQLVTLEEKKRPDNALAPSVEWNRDGHYFGVFFPSREKHLVSKMGFWMFSSGLLLIVVLFFGYTISVILKQKRLSEIKTDFINNMTHELKTPISTISLSSQVLMKPSIKDEPERLKSYAGIIFNENNRLKTLVERVLQIATLEKEKLNLNKKNVDVHRVIENAVQSIELNVKEKGGAICLQKNADNPEILADEFHMTNIIYNLLDNADKYSPGKPDITVSTRNTEKGVVISVEDKGMGISEKDQKYIFDKFYRVPTGNVHNVKGFGLGLHYVKLMTEAHRGLVKLKSTIGKGSRFDLFLPQKVK